MEEEQFPWLCGSRYLKLPEMMGLNENPHPAKDMDSLITTYSCLAWHMDFETEHEDFGAEAGRNNMLTGTYACPWPGTSSAPSAFSRHDDDARWQHHKNLLGQNQWTLPLCSPSSGMDGQTLERSRWTSSLSDDTLPLPLERFLRETERHRDSHDSLMEYQKSSTTWQCQGCGWDSGSFQRKDELLVLVGDYHDPSASCGHKFCHECPLANSSTRRMG
ncbi:hypothetical protein ONS95_011008 [Cadophora gregata]|uniref:uncharacterized protein n=1 Tax=Cadophora gregata TaxID=51156 RepID=UPI0026DA81C9|nr:uncharacterized protein ONS95_011008 [Cadophora gregata]KAK0119568.1 hypothetical protein ONS95_011008 [Cadophora gregata]KAK0120604.1 hypothetical protein ONS96_010808 [Cadophora gregata f. sp. sojae]